MPVLDFFFFIQNLWILPFTVQILRTNACCDGVAAASVNCSSYDSIGKAVIVSTKKTPDWTEQGRHSLLAVISTETKAVFELEDRKDNLYDQVITLT